MIYVSNLLPITVLDGRFSFEASTKSLLKLNHLRMLGLIVYVFINEKKKKTKSAK